QQRQPAIVMVGPTGSGKTPLGEWLQHHGLWGRRCHHFDFGQQLRDAVRTESLPPAETRFLQGVLERGELLDSEHFHLALKILDGFIAQRQPSANDLLVMNGLPRHVGQAEALRSRLETVAVVWLQCDAATVTERLRRNSGGDHAGRADDAPELVERKLRLFTERTLPLIEYYRRHGVPVIEVAVGLWTQPGEIAAQLSAQWHKVGSS
ncbi:MAG: nucleoside monophosphate kinase, partial [Verrucomicrobiae bacterium]|nr:nucleoside monophosphate kinase [Verrucomicrobiae bacterium]